MKVSEILNRDKNNLDLVRIIVATMVIWSHAFALTFGNGANEPLFKFLKVTYAGALGVDIFFFMSGLLVTNSILSKKSVSKFIISRFFRIFPALLLLILITVFIIGPIVSTLPISEYFRQSSTWNYFFQNLYLKTNYLLPGCFETNIWPADVNGSLWTLTYEVACYIFLVSVFVLSKGKSRIINVTIIVVVFLAFLPNNYLLSIFNRSFIIATIPMACFAIGAFFALNKEKITLNINLLVGLLLLSLVFWRFETIISIVFPITISVFFLLFSTNKTVLKLMPKYDISYGLYIWHFVIQQIVFLYFGSMNVYLFFIITFILTAAISLLSYVFVEHRSINYGYILGKKLSETKFDFEKLYIYFALILFVIILAKLS